MTKQEFLFRLKKASLESLQFAERYVSDKLTEDNFKYNVIFTPAHPDENLNIFDIYPEDNGVIESNLTYTEVINLLHRKNKIPVWIDICVTKANKKSTIFDLLCAGRYSDNEENYYYNDNNSGPFGIKSPVFPIAYKEGKKFKLQQKNSFRKLYFKIYFMIRRLSHII